ncbi:CLUMA_CG018977, isoform A [Clunio marinus]|uniref:CLUMA_CG018977, isoform A n=1 Tax=Clunio marinus TaxID=568069 RepID=A0A1J1J098_9DIPT|nr:CLUMA_CG018977, isoform A [Clunio marinus]
MVDSIMNKIFEKVKTFMTEACHCCCFGSVSNYGFMPSYSRSIRTHINLIEPLWDDIMQPFCDNYDDNQHYIHDGSRRRRDRSKRSHHRQSPELDIKQQRRQRKPFNHEKNEAARAKQLKHISYEKQNVNFN